MDAREAAAALRADPARSAVVLDFDGTLAEIAPTPEAATPVPGAREAVEALAERFGLVAVVSGRRVADVRERLGAEGVRYLGLYGSEDADGAGLATPVPPPGLLAELRTAAAAIDGALIEPKGANVAIHYRLATDPSAEARLAEVTAELARRHGLRVMLGKQVLELAPADAPTKGEAVRRLLVGLSAAAYAGDDVADLEAFAALDDLARERGIFRVRIAVRSRETPAAVTAAADLGVAGPRGLVRFLRALVAD